MKLQHGHRKTSAHIAFWDSREALSDDFAAAWNAAMRAAPHAHFACSLDYLRWEADHQRHSRALLIEEGSRRGLMVLRRSSGGRWVSGWPWRWQAVICGADPGAPHGMTPADAAWLHEQAARASGNAELLTYLPHAPTNGASAWFAGATVVQHLAHSDEELFESMEPSKRRLVRRAKGHELEVAVATTEAEHREFHRLQQASKARRGLPNELTPDQVDDFGDSWREWELPWMWLLVARRGGELLAGLGDGIHRGGSMEGRTAASSMEARKLGATVLLGYEETRQGRDLGHRWLNHGGDTPFKREMSGRLGRRVRVHAWLGGGSGRLLLQRGEAVLRSMRPALARLRRRLRIGRASGTTGVFAKALAVMPLLAELPGL